MNGTATEADGPKPSARSGLRRGPLITALGITQILNWGSSFYLLTVLGAPISRDTGLPLGWTIGGFSLGLLVAGLVSPRVGRAIDERGGRAVLALGSAMLALGLAGLALSAGLVSYLATWCVIGIGMGMGLYDPAFATLGRIYGEKARGPITTLTLFGGFASTVAWPLSAFFVASFGWRGACLGYAALHLALGLPIHLAFVPGKTARAAARPRTPNADAPPGQPASQRRSRGLIALWAASLTLHAGVSSILSVHLLTILQGFGISLAGAVALGTLIGPSQVGARVVEAVVARRFHPVWTAITASLLVAGGFAALVLGGPAAAAAALVAYGAGNGIQTIARGAVPLSLFGAAGYATLMGRLALPGLAAQAVSPPIAALFVGRDAAATVGILAALALGNVLVVLVLRSRVRAA